MKHKFFLAASLFIAINCQSQTNCCDSAIYFRAINYKNNGDFEKAITDLSSFINPNLVEEVPRLMRAECYLYIGNKTLAKEDMDFVYARKPGSELHARLVVRAATIAQPREKKPGVSSNSKVKTLFNRAEQLLIERRLSESFAKIDSAITLEPSNPHLYILESEILYYIINSDLKKELEEDDFDITKDDYWKMAVQDLTTSIKINKNNWDAYYWRGAYYVLAKNKTKASADLKKAMELNPGEAKTKMLLESLNGKNY